MKHEFTIHVDPPHDWDEDAVVDAVCGHPNMQDMTLSCCDRKWKIHFHREASDAHQAIESAKSDIESAGLTPRHVEQ